MNCICTQSFLPKTLVFPSQLFGRGRAQLRVGYKSGPPKRSRSLGLRQSSGGPDGTATFATTDKDMVKKLSYFTITLLILGINFGGIGVDAYGVSAATGIHGAASHIATSFPESGSLALLGSILITGATLLRRKWAAHAK